MNIFLITRVIKITNISRLKIFLRYANKNSVLIVFLKQNTLGEVRRKLLKVFYALPPKKIYNYLLEHAYVKKIF